MARWAAGHYDEQIDQPAEAELAALVDDVNALARALAETEQRRAELVSDVAHELRNPLTTIRGYAEGLLDGVIAPDRDVPTAVLAEVGHLQRLAGDLSTLSRADEGRLTLAAAPVDLHDLATAVVESFRSRALELGVALRVVGAPATVRGDRDRLVQVVGNLVANALTFTPAGGNVTVEVRASGATATATVTDTGIGLAPDDLERVFERFYRVHGVERPPAAASASPSPVPSAAPTAATSRPPPRVRGRARPSRCDSPPSPIPPRPDHVRRFIEASPTSREALHPLAASSRCHQTQEVVRMRKLHKGLAAAAVGLAVLVPTGIAVGQTPTPPNNPICTEEQREERWAVRDQLRVEIRDQLQQEGVTDPNQLRDQVRTRLHDEMEERFGEVNGPQAGGMGGGGRHLGPMDGTGYGRGANR